MNICVTGASGFIGTNLCFYLERQGCTVYPICTSTGLVSDHFKKTAVYQGLFGFDTSVLKHCEGIVHLAANNDTVSTQNSEMLRANFYDSKKLLRLGRKNFHKFFIFASSTAVYGKINKDIDETSKTKANNSYSKSKLKFDKYMTKTDPYIKWVGLRLCNVYGPHEENKGRRSSYLGQMLTAMMNNERVPLFEDGSQRRDWCHVEDVCQAFYRAIHSKYTGIYNIGSGNSYTFNELYDKLAKLTNYTEKPLWKPNIFAKQYQDNVTLNIEKAREVLSYEPIFDLDKGIKSYFEWKKTTPKYK